VRFVGLLALAAAALLVVLYFGGGEWNFTRAPARDTPAGRPAPAAETAALRGSRAGGALPTPPKGEKTTPRAEGDPAPWHLLARVNDDQGQAIAGATVTIWLARDQDYEFVREARTGAEGQVDLDLSVLVGRTRNHLARRRLLGWAFAPGHVLPSGMPCKIHWLFPNHVEPGVWRMDFELQKSRVAAGRVVDERGLGLASVQVSVGSPEEQRPDFLETSVFTAPDGRYVLPLTTTEKSNVVAAVRGYQRAASGWLQPKGTGDVRVPDLALAPLEPVPGIARFPDGSPVAGLTLTVWHGSLNPHGSTWSPSLGPITARTDASGRFALALPPLPPDEEEPYRFVLEGRAGAMGIPLERDAKLHALTLPPHRLRVRVQDDRAAPLSGLELSFVALPPAWAVTDAEGEASLFLSPGTVGEIHFLAAGNQLVRRAVNVPAEGNESVLRIEVPDVRDMGALDLRLTAPEGLAIPHAQLTIRSGVVEITTEPLKDGRVRVPLPAGTYRGSLLARRLDWFPGSPATFASMDVPESFVIRGGTTLERTEAWTRTARLSVRAHPRELGEPVKWRTWLQRAGEKDQLILLETSPGDIAGEPLPWNELLYSSLVEPGAYVFHIDADGYRPWQREVQLTHAHLEHVDVELERAK
jgi:hypothetical protein